MLGAGFRPKPTPGPNFIKIGVGVRTLVSRSLIYGLLIQSIISQKIVASFHIDLDIFTNKGLGSSMSTSSESDNFEKVPKTVSGNTRIKEEQK